MILEIYYTINTFTDVVLKNGRGLAGKCGYRNQEGQDRHLLPDEHGDHRLSVAARGQPLQHRALQRRPHHLPRRAAAAGRGRGHGGRGGRVRQLRGGRQGRGRGGGRARQDSVLTRLSVDTSAVND